MDQELKTGRVGSTPGSNGNPSSFEGLLATASGTSTHHVAEGRSVRNTVSGRDSGIIPIYSSLDHGQLPSTLGIHGNRSSNWNERRFNDYEENEESHVNFDQNGMYAQASNSRTYQTPLGPSRSSVGVRMRFGHGGLSIETSMHSMIPSGDGRMLMLSSSGMTPFPSFGQMMGRFIPSGLPSSSFRGMMSPHLSSTHLFEQSPFRNMQTDNSMYGYPQRSSFVNDDYTGPIITEIPDDDDDVVVIEEKKKVEENENHKGPIITEIYDDDDSHVDVAPEKKAENNGSTDTQPSNDQASLDRLFTVTDNVTHDTLQYNENTEKQNCVDSKEFDRNDRMLNASEVTDLTGNLKDLEHTEIDRVEDSEYNVSQPVQSKGIDNETGLKPHTENKHTVADAMSDPNESVHTNIENKPASRRKRVFRTQSFVHTPLPFEDMLIGPSESNPDISGSPISLPSPEIDSDKLSKMNGHFSEDKESMEKIEVARILTNLSNRDIGKSDITNEIPSRSKHGEDASLDSEKDCCNETTSLVAFSQSGGKEEVDTTHSLNRVSDCNVDDFESSEHEINDSFNAVRKIAHSNMLKSDILSDQQNCQKVVDVDQQVQEYSEFGSPSSEDHLQSLPNLDCGQNFDNVPRITSPLQDKRDDGQWQYPRQLMKQGKCQTAVSERSSVVSISQKIDENDLEHDGGDLELEGDCDAVKKEQPHQQQQQQQHQWQQTWPQQQQQQWQQHHQQQLQQTWPQKQQQQQQLEQHQTWPQQQNNHQQHHQQWQQQQWHQTLSKKQQQQQQLEQKQQQKQDSHDRQQQFTYCSGHLVENGSQFLSCCQHSPEDISQQKCSHKHVHKYHTNINTTAFMCQDCGKEKHFTNCHCHTHVHNQSHEGEQNHPHGNEYGHPDGHVEPSAEHFNNNNATSTGSKQKRNKNATVRVNKSFTENSEHNSSSQSTTKKDLGTGHDLSQSTTKKDLGTGHDLSQSTTKNELVTDTPNDNRHYEYPAHRSDGLNVLIESIGLQMKDVIPDGNCLFTAITDQLRIRGDFSFTARTLRYAAVEYLRKNPNQDDDTPLFEFLDEHEGSWDEYLNKMSRDGHWGDHIVIFALAHVLNRRIIIYRGNVELSSTVVEPSGNVTLNENELSTESSVDVTKDDKEDKDTILDEMYLGHVSQSHYVSLRPLDWKDKLMQELKNKSTSCLIGSNPESRNIGKDETKTCGVPCEHFTFASKYIQMSDIIFKFRKSSSENEDKQMIAMYNPLMDIMNAHIISGDKHSSQNYPRDTFTDTFFTPTDTIVVSSRDNANSKDLLCDDNNCLPGYTKLVPIEPWRWPKVLDKRQYLTHLKFNHPNGEQSAMNRTVAFRCEWPKEAKEWIERPRKYGWPPEYVMTEIEHHYCFVIPQSKDDVTKWKYSFQQAEHILAEQALSEPQLECFHIIKLMLDTIQKDCSIGLRVLKQVFFYTCEELGDQLWHCDTLACIHMFLDRLLVNLRYGTVKGYFLEQENFLDDELCGDALDKYISDIEILKNHTFPLLYFTFDAYVQLHTSLNMLFDRLIEDVLVNALQTDYNVTVHSCFLPLVTEGVSVLWQSKHYLDAFNRSMRAVHQINSMRQMTYQLSQQDVILSVLHSLNSLLNKWLYAFCADLNLGTSYVDTVNDQHSSCLLHDMYGPTLADYVHQKCGSRTIPYELLHVTRLGQTSVALLRLLQQMQLPMNIYDSVISRCPGHLELILNSIQSVAAEDQKWMLIDVKDLLYMVHTAIHDMQRNIASNKTLIVKNLISKAEYHKATGNIKEYKAALDEARIILESLEKKDPDQIEK